MRYGLYWQGFAAGGVRPKSCLATRRQTHMVVSGQEGSVCGSMKHHIMISLGILMGLIFAFRAAVAILEPGLGFREAYLLGGLVLSGWLILGGIAEWRHARKTQAAPGPEAD